jgi:hypothetical protein
MYCLRTQTQRYTICQCARKGEAMSRPYGSSDVVGCSGSLLPASLFTIFSLPQVPGMPLALTGSTGTSVFVSAD